MRIWNEDITHSKETRPRVQGRYGNDVSNNREQHQADDVNTAIRETTRCVCHNKRDEKCCNPGRRRKEQGLDGPKPKSLHDRGEEILESLR